MLSPAAPKPYSDLPADWRSPVLPPMNIPNDSEGNSAGQGGGAGGSTEAPSEEDTRARDKYAAEALKAATRVQAARIAQSPPGIEGLQTENQRRRALPLSKLKRIKPKVRIFDDDEGEFRPLVPKTDRESVLRGEDYWIDYREEDAKAARKKARTKAPAPDQFAQSKMKAEIVNPYKQNWILAISLGIVAIAGLIRLDPGILDDPSIITFPTEL